MRMRRANVGVQRVEVPAIPGEQVEYSESRNSWSCRDGQIVADSLEELRAKVRALSKRSFRRRKVYIIHGDVANLSTGTVTSVSDHRSFRGWPTYWVVQDASECSRSRRCVESSDVLYEASPENKKVLLRMLDLLKQRRKLEAQCKRLLETMKRAFPADRQQEGS